MTCFVDKPQPGAGVVEHGDNAQSSRCRHDLHCLYGLDLVYAEKGPLAAADPRSRRMGKALLHTGWFSVDDEPAHFFHSC